MCDPRDLGTVVEMRARETGRPTVYLYDRVPGGAGFSERLYDLLGDLLRAARDVVGSCPCRGGCPSCVGPSTEVGPDVKASTLGLLDALLAP
jgi:DEAD/DEAH box helicase domain-containing protein